MLKWPNGVNLFLQDFLVVAVRGKIVQNNSDSKKELQNYTKKLRFGGVEA